MSTISMGKKDETLDLVDSEDTVIGTILRKDEFTKPPGTYVRVVNCFVFNSKKEIFVPTRSSSKKMFPGALDFSCGGLVSSGEQYEDAMRREILEELGIEVGANLSAIGKIGPDKLDSDTYCMLYRLVYDGEIGWNRKDFKMARWMRKGEVLQEIEEGVSFKRDLDVLLRSVLL